MNERSRWVSHQAAALLGVAVGWCIWPGAGLFFLLGCYLVVLAAAQVASYYQARLLPPLTRGQKALGVTVLVLVMLFTGLRFGTPLVHSEGWKSVSTQLSDRWALEGQPVIFPQQLYATHPQRLFVYDEGADDIQMVIGGERPLSQRLGHGVWCFDYDPRRAGFPLDRCGPLSVELVVDGRAVSRELTAVVTQPHPRWPQANAQLGLGACASEETDELFCVDRLGNLLRIATGDGPSDCVVLPDGMVAVCHRYLPEVWIVDPRTGEISTRLATDGWQYRMELSPDGAWLAIGLTGTKPAIGWIDVAARRYVGATPLDFVPEWLKFGPDASTLVVSCTRDQTLRLLRATDASDPSTWQPAGDPIRLGRPARSMCRGAEGRFVYFASSGWSSTGAHFVGGNHYVEHLVLGLDIEAWRIARRFDTEGRGNIQSAPGASDLGIDPLGLAPIDANTLMVTYAGSNQIGPLRLAGGNPVRARSLAQVGIRVPHGVADLGEHCWLLADPAGAALAVYKLEDNECVVVHVGLDDEQLAAHDPRAWEQRLGETVFYEGTQAGISCNSCHMNADSDHGLHDISDLTPTLSVRGVGGTSPYLRVPSYGSLVELHQELAGGLFGGYQDQAPYDRAKMLDAFVTTLPRPVNPNWFETPPDQLQAGMDAFVAGGCQHCHVPPAFTNLAQHPENWLFPQREHSYGRLLDTPSLLQAPAKSYWLVDGRAESIGAVIEDHNESNRHGDTASLDPAARRTLVQLLESL